MTQEELKEQACDTVKEHWLRTEYDRQDSLAGVDYQYNPNKLAHQMYDTLETSRCCYEYFNDKYVDKDEREEPGYDPYSYAAEVFEWLNIDLCQTYLNDLVKLMMTFKKVRGDRAKGEKVLAALLKAHKGILSACYDLDTDDTLDINTDEMNDVDHPYNREWDAGCRLLGLIENPCSITYTKK